MMKKDIAETDFAAGDELGSDIPLTVSAPDQPGGPTKEQYHEVLNVTAGLAEALDKAGVDVQIAASAAILLAAELSAQSGHPNKHILECFRRTFVDARRRWRQAQN